MRIHMQKGLALYKNLLSDVPSIKNNAVAAARSIFHRNKFHFWLSISFHDEHLIKFKTRTVFRNCALFKFGYVYWPPASLHCTRRRRSYKVSRGSRKRCRKQWGPFFSGCILENNAWKKSMQDDFMRKKN